MVLPLTPSHINTYTHLQTHTYICIHTQEVHLFILFQFYENDFAILLFIFIVFSVFYLANMSRASGADAGLPTPISQIKQKDKNYLRDM